VAPNVGTTARPRTHVPQRSAGPYWRGAGGEPPYGPRALTRWPRPLTQCHPANGLTEDPAHPWLSATNQVIHSLALRSALSSNAGPLGWAPSRPLMTAPHRPPPSGTEWKGTSTHINQQRPAGFAAHLTPAWPTVTGRADATATVRACTSMSGGQLNAAGHRSDRR
jgi:hypothetical protein